MKYVSFCISSRTSDILCSARYCTNLLAFARIDTFSPVPHQCARRSSCIPILTSIHPFGDLPSHPPITITSNFSNAARTPSYPEHLHPLPTCYSRNSYPPYTGSIAPPSHITSQVPRLFHQQPWPQEYHCLCSSNRRTGRFAILFRTSNECSSDSPGRRSPA